MVVIVFQDQVLESDCNFELSRVPRVVFSSLIGVGFSPNSCYFTDSNIQVLLISGWVVMVPCLGLLVHSLQNTLHLFYYRCILIIKHLKNRYGMFTGSLDPVL